MTVRATLQAVIDATTVAAVGDAKAQALVGGMLALLAADMCGPSAVTPNQMNKLADLQAEFTTNVAAVTTALAAT